MTNFRRAMSVRERQQLLEGLAGAKGRPNTDSLASVVASIEFILATLGGPDSAWSEDVHSRWAVLEEVYAVALDEGRATFTEQEQELLRRIIDELHGLIAEAGPENVE